MGLSRGVSIYRGDKRIWLRFKSGLLKGFTPTGSSELRLYTVLRKLDRAKRIGYIPGFAGEIGCHLFIDPIWLR